MGFSAGCRVGHLMCATQNLQVRMVRITLLDSVHRDECRAVSPHR
jgi:hypothetical protein